MRVRGVVLEPVRPKAYARVVFIKPALGVKRPEKKANR